MPENLGIDGRIGEGLDIARQVQRAARLGALQLDGLHTGNGLGFGPLLGTGAGIEAQDQATRHHKDGNDQRHHAIEFQARRGVMAQDVRLHAGI